MKSYILFPLLLVFCTASHGGTMHDYTFEKIVNNTWVIHGPLEEPNAKNHGFMNNPGVVITQHSVVIIDPGSSLQAGEMVLRALKKITDKPVSTVFNTHIHGDHWLGNQAIKNKYPNVKIYGHPEMISNIKDGAGDTWVSLMERLTEGATRGTKVVPPTHTANNKNTIEVDGIRFVIHHYGQAHTQTDIMIEIAQEDIVFLGDNVLLGRLASSISGTNFKGNIASIDNILKTKVKYWVPGHGKTGSASDVKKYSNYLTTVYSTAQKAFNDDLDSSDVRALLLKVSGAYKNWVGYDAAIGRHGIQAYMEVEASEF